MEIFELAFLVAIKMPLFPILLPLRIPDIFIAACVRMDGLDINLIITELGDIQGVALEPDRLKNRGGSPQST